MRGYSAGVTQLWVVLNFEPSNFGIASNLKVAAQFPAFGLGTFQRPTNQLSYIHDLNGDLIPSDIGGHCPYTLLAGGNDCLGARCQNLLDLLSGYLC